jgi:hypothetical protein
MCGRRLAVEVIAYRKEAAAIRSGRRDWSYIELLDDDVIATAIVKGSMS